MVLFRTLKNPNFTLVFPTLAFSLLWKTKFSTCWKALLCPDLFTHLQNGAEAVFYSISPSFPRAILPPLLYSHPSTQKAVYLSLILIVACLFSPLLCEGCISRTIAWRYICSSKGFFINDTAPRSLTLASEHLCTPIYSHRVVLCFLRWRYYNKLQCVCTCTRSGHSENISSFAKCAWHLFLD